MNTLFHKLDNQDQINNENFTKVGEKKVLP